MLSDPAFNEYHAVYPKARQEIDYAMYNCSSYWKSKDDTLDVDSINVDMPQTDGTNDNNGNHGNASDAPASANQNHGNKANEEATEKKKATVEEVYF